MKIISKILSQAFLLLILSIDLIALNGFFAAGLCQADSLAAFKQKMDHNIGKNDSLMIVDHSGKVIYAKNEKRMRIPASTLKVLTALAALHYLGDDFRYKTEFYLNAQNDLIIKGYGDPLFISELMQKIAPSISQAILKTTQKVNRMLLDDTFFSKPVEIPGRTKIDSDPYNAPNGALCANFNTIYFKRSPQKNGYISAEPQTPLLPFAIPRIKATRFNQGRIILNDQHDEITLYCGHLMAYFLRQSGIEATGSVEIGKHQPKDRLIFTYHSEFTIQQVIAKLLEFSNNFIANQLLLTIGAHINQTPGTLAKGTRAIINYAKNNLKIDNNFNMVEGSGLSRKNRITAYDLMKVLATFEPYYQLMRSDKYQYYKTGTLHGIQTRIGYFKTTQDRLLKYVLMINTPHKQSAPIIRQIANQINKWNNKKIK